MTVPCSRKGADVVALVVLAMARREIAGARALCGRGRGNRSCRRRRRRRRRGGSRLRGFGGGGRGRGRAQAALFTMGVYIAVERALEVAGLLKAWSGC